LTSGRRSGGSFVASRTGRSASSSAATSPSCRCSDTRARSAMSDLGRAAAFEEELRDRWAARAPDTRFGPALFNDPFSTIWTPNVLRADRPGQATAAEIAAEADRVQAELGHRRVILPTGVTELEDGFREFGWEGDHFLFMVYRGGG